MNNTVMRRETRLWPELYDMVEGLPLWFGRGSETELTMRVEALPTGALPERIKATYDRGVLEIRIPMSEPMVTSKHVPVTVTG